LSLFDNLKAGQKLSAQQAKAISVDNISEKVTLFYYTLRNDFQLSVIESQSVSNFHPIMYEGDDIDVLVYDHACLKIWRTFQNALSEFNERGTSIEHMRQKAIESFRKSITATVYSRIDSIKHEADVLAELNRMLTMLSSIVDDSQ
jgi:hypothetical protein